MDGVTAANTAGIAGTTTLNATKSTSNVTFANPATFNGPVSVNAGANATVTTNDSLTLANSTVGGNLVVTVAGGNGLIVGGNQNVGGTVSLTADSDITLTGGLISSSASASAVSLTSNTGGIFDGDVTEALDIDAVNGGLVANTVTGFGTLTNPIETRLDSVDINTTGVGEVNIFETDSLDIVNINHSGTGDINVSFLGNLTGEANAFAANGIETFTNRNKGSLFLPEFGKTLSEVSTEKTILLAPHLEEIYSFGSEPAPSEGNTVAEMLSGPESGPFVTNVFDENFELVKVAKKSRKAHKGLKGFSNFWGPQGTKNIEMVKRPSKKQVREEAKLKMKRDKKRRSMLKKKARSKMKNAKVKRVGDTAQLPKIKQKKKPSTWRETVLEKFFK